MKAVVSCFAVLLALGPSALGSIRITHRGEDVAAAEVCYYRALGTRTPFEQQFGSDRITCRKATRTLELPAGLWNLYARAEGLISATAILLDSTAPLPDHEFRLEPAALVDFSDQKSQWPGGAYAALYLTDTATLFPLARGDAELRVPAGRDLVPFLLHDGKPIAVGPPLRLNEKTRTTIAPLKPSATRTDLITWLSIDQEDQKALRASGRPQPPRITVTSSSGSSKTPVNPVRGAITLDRAVQVIRDLPRDVVTLEVSGSPWRAQRRKLAIPEAVAVLVTDAPVHLQPTSTAVLVWTATANLNDFSERLVSTCVSGDERSLSDEMLARILRCPGLQDLRIFDRESCAVLVQRNLPEAEGGEIRFEDLDAGQYLLEIQFQHLPAIRRMFSIAKFQETRLDVPIEFITLNGKVTIGDENSSERIRIDFDYTETQRVVTNEEGEYFAVLERAPRAEETIALRSCDGSLEAVHIVEQDVAPNSRYDIKLPSNTVSVEAVDARSGRPVVGALVRYGAFRTDEIVGDSRYYFRLPIVEDETGRKVPARTNVEGRLTVKSITSGKVVRLCLEHEDYERTCPDGFKLTPSEHKTVRVAMTPLTSFRGKVHTALPIAAGSLYWFSPDGRRTERVEVKPNGSFGFNQRHTPQEVVVFVSASHPLFIFAQPFLQTDELMEVAVPPAAVRSFQVRLSEELMQTDAVVTIAIGALVVPYPPFAQHLALHGSTLVLQNRGPLLVRDILETGPISVLLGPSPGMVPDIGGTDLFRLPQFHASPRILLGNLDQVIFDRKSGARSHLSVASK